MIDIEGCENDNSLIELVDMTGRILRSYTVVNTPLFEMPVEEIPCGNYIIKVSSNDNLIIESVIIL